MPNVGQILLIVSAAAALGVSAALAPSPRSRPLAILAIVIALATLAWHSISRGSWVPLEHNFDALVWLGLLIAIFVAYVQWRRPVAGLEWFVLPIASMLFLGAAYFGRFKPHEYIDSTWSWVHRLSSFASAVALAIAGAGGLMYLIANRRLRDKTRVWSSPLGSLERLEHLTFLSVTLGFALLTIAVVTGLDYLVRGRAHAEGWLAPKILLGMGVWIVYAVALHAPIAPALRGRKVAILSVCGFVLLVGTIVATQLLPGGPR